MAKKSEFGQGTAYCLGLFLAHADRIRYELKVYEKIGDENMAYEMWFNGAGDHLFEFIPEHLPTGYRKRGQEFRRKVLDWRLTMGRKSGTKKDYDWAIQEAKDLLGVIDKDNGVPVIKGDYE